MRWFYIILAAAAVAGSAVAVNHVADIFGHRTLQAIIAASVMVICFALLKFVSKLRD